ncbi:MAG: RT0821/Lpp0805 family surface protein, partial [Pseudomonadota bacterium]
GGCQTFSGPDPDVLSASAGSNLHNTTLLESLETLPDRSSLHWSDPETGAEGYAVPLGTYRTADGRFCRDYYTKAIVNGGSTLTQGTACRLDDGSWAINRTL